MSPPAASGQYFEPEPEASSRPSSVDLVLPDLTLRLRTDRGVFSAGRIDRGTMLLLRNAPAPPPDAVVLDLGCGYGPIAVTVALRSQGSTVWAVEVNERARELCRANAETLGLGDVHVAAPDEVPSEVSFDIVYSNPPVRIGKRALRQLLATWLARLSAGGEAWLVVHRHLGADSLADWLTTQRWTVERVRSKAGYRLMRLEHR